MEKNEQLFFELIQVALGTRDVLSKVPSAKQWLSVYDAAVRQSVIGVTLEGIDICSTQGIKPPLNLLYEWIGTVEQIRSQNGVVNKRAKEIFADSSLNGKWTCVLKGQGIALLYPKPDLRQSGDIDLWVEGSREETLRYLKNRYGKYGKVFIHHTDVEAFADVEVEIHFMPIWLYCPWNNRRLQQFFKKQEGKQFSNYDEKAGFCHPTGEFNAVYVLLHIFHHLMDEGVGLRQVIDYYYVLMHLTDKQREATMNTLKSIGLGSFAAAMMYVLQEVCIMERNAMLCEPHEQEGRFILNEILIAGNFGQYDCRQKKQGNEGAWRRNKRKSSRLWQFVKYYPEEVLCIPFWKCWHWCWRKKKGYL